MKYSRLRDRIGSDARSTSITLILTGIYLLAASGCSSEPRTITSQGVVVTNPAMTPEFASALSAELIERMERDQAVRTIDFPSLTNEERNAALEEMGEVDKANTARMKEIVNKYGWPTITMVGKDASSAAFILVQHADHDPEFQARCLLMLENVATRGDVRLVDLAFLTDRVRVKQNKPQLYGTQYAVGKYADGVTARSTDGNFIYLVPIVEDVSRLDVRRTAAGLGPWSEYEAMMANMQQREPVALPRDWDGTLPVDHTRVSGDN